MDLLKISLLLIACTGVFAFTGGTGAISNPFQIATADDLEQVNDDLNACYILIADIDLTGRVYSGAIIAPDEEPATNVYEGDGFNGIFDGNGFKITMPQMLNPDPNYVGLFGYIGAGGNIWNLAVDGGDVRGDEYVGAIAALNFGTIWRSYSQCEVIGNYYAGGLVGMNFGIISTSYAIGNVSGGFFLGGLVGLNQGFSIYQGKILNSYARGLVMGVGDFGGFVGNNYGSINNCYSSGLVVDGVEYSGGFIGWQSSNYGNVNNCFWDTLSSTQPQSAAGEGKTTTQMQDAETFKAAGWDFVDEHANGTMYIWCMLGNGYPKLYWQAQTGDINYDGVFDILDIVVLFDYWLEDITPGQRLFADLNGDGVVDLLDYAIIAKILRQP